MQDTEMVNHAQNGNLNAYEELMAIHHRTVEKFAFQCGVKVEDIQSVTHEIFIKLYKALGESKSAHFTIQLYKVTLNAAREYHRRETHAKEEVQDLPDNSVTQSIRLPQSKILVFDEDRELHDAFQLVGEKFRNPLILHYFHELTYEEIGEILNISSVEVESRLFSSREHIKLLLEVLADSQFEQNLNLLKKSYKRIPSKFKADEVILRIESEKGMGGDSFSSNNLGNLSNQKVNFWVVALACTLLIGVLSTSFIKNDDEKNLEVANAADIKSIDEYKKSFEEQKTTYRNTLGIPEEEFNQIGFVRLADQLFALNFKEDSSENESNRATIDERYEEVLEVLKMPSQMINDATAGKQMSEEESAIFVNELNTKIDDLTTYYNSVLEKHREILNTAKMSGRLDATYLRSNRYDLPVEVENLINNGNTQGISIRVSRDENRYEAFFEFPNHWQNLYETVGHPAISFLQIKSMIPFTYGGELILTPLESAMYLNHLEQVLLSTKHRNSLYAIIKSQYEDLAYTLIFGATNTEVITNGRVNTEFQAVWNSLRYSHGDSPMKYFIRPMFESVSENNWVVNETYRSLNFNDLKVAFTLAENGELAAIMPKEVSGAKSATISWPNSEVEQKVAETIENTDLTPISQIVGLSPIESVVLYQYAQKANLSGINHQLLSFMNFTDHENFEKVMNSWLNYELIPKEATSLRYQDENTFELHGNFVGSIDVLNGDQVIRTIPVNRSHQGVWTIDASLSYLLYSEPHVVIREQTIKDIEDFYTRFKENYDYTILKDVGATMVAGIYLEAASQGDLNTQYELLLKGENRNAPSREEFLSSRTVESDWKKQYQAMESHQDYPSIESILSSIQGNNDEFDVTVWLYLKPELVTNEFYRNGIQMRKTVDGWRVYYMPIQ